MIALKMKLYPLDQFIAKALLSLSVFLTPIVPVLITVSILIIADAITGIWASLKKGKKFSSARFFSSLNKLFFYLLLLLISNMVQVYLVPGIPFLQVSIYFIVFYEFSSFLENVGIITGRDVFTWFRQSLNKLKFFQNVNRNEDLSDESV